MAARTLTQYLLDINDEGERRADLAHILSAVAVSMKLIAAMVSRGPLILDRHPRSTLPTALEESRTLRKLATRTLLEQTESVEQLGAISIAGDPRIFPMSPAGRYLLLFEALHGMSNVIDNLPVGSAFSVLARDTALGPVSERDFLQPGTRQVSAGVALFGPRTVLVLTTGQGVDGFTLDRDIGNFVLTHPQLKIPTIANTFAIDASDAPRWPVPVKRYVEECVLGVAGPRGHDFRMRWSASAVVGAFRVLNRGGVFLVPESEERPGWGVPLLHNAAPLAFLAEQAGGGATTGKERVLEVTASELTSRVPLILGSASEVARIEDYYAEHEQGYDKGSTYPLFHRRTLFVDEH